ncbi:uncharacterized protein LOC134830668 [Culicoides brevitarsis]|uniref:uncharacterized protein LOC134830668 n=1 Tax=Culicoides brevitarsis TaxID=469753 RepID=UPI00307BCF92
MMKNNEENVQLVLRSSNHQIISVKESLDSLFVKDLVSKVSKNIESSNVAFIFRGKLLKNDLNLKSQGIKSGSVIQVIPKKEPQTSKEKETLTEQQVQEIIWSFRKISPSMYHKASRPDFLEKILKMFPALFGNLNAVSIIKDPILLATLGNPDTVRRLAEGNRELIDVSKSVVEQLQKKPSTSTSYEDPDLDSSSSSEDQNSGSRSITSTQLAQALGQVLSGTSDANNAANSENPNRSGENVGTPPNRITSSMFLNALSEVIRSTRNTNATRSSVQTERTEPRNSSPEPRSEEINSAQSALYANELQIMREMGLTDPNLCIRALIVSNGDLEAAINLLFSERSTD